MEHCDPKNGTNTFQDKTKCIFLIKIYGTYFFCQSYVNLQITCCEVIKIYLRGVAIK
jgi:hypothetical protein